MKKFLVAALASLAVVCGTAFAAPSVQQIESAMSQGDWSRADSGLREVLEAHPNSAHAHYLYAQVLDREGRYSAALDQVQQARTLDPQLHFTSPSRFAEVESHIRADAARAGGGNHGTSFAQPQTAQTATVLPTAAFGAAPQRHGPSAGAWIGIAIVLVLIAAVLRWTLRRARSNDDARATEDRHEQLRRVTELLNAVRSLKLDVRLSTEAGHDVLAREAEALEAQLRQVAEALSNSPNPVAPYQIEDLERQVDSLKARAEGRPDPNAPPHGAIGSDSAYAREADASFGRQPPYPPYYPPQAPQQVIVQQGGGFGSGVGGLLTGVMLGEALGGERDRVVERDVIVDDNGNNNVNDGGLDFGQGSNDWDDGGGVDYGSNDDSGGGWDNS
ncbi:hypothetical protein CY652_03050 [Burkholderia sp. WAC0059]|uniref:tetratricopeptide repeat protein n=1 Tax=Burkholderia sp. WAC0059 TaxID=2066022 RepID=UPI000C7E97DC|nr:tetratricopeptide repeat protein [Burkholderia sp. WAC0059]PLZ03963.1 hypothetical protein CY652_03050 [Burkholderia sp. WAC0059]